MWFLNLFNGWKRNSGIIIVFVAMILKPLGIELPAGFEDTITNVLTGAGSVLAAWGTIADIVKKIIEKKKGK